MRTMMRKAFTSVAVAIGLAAAAQAATPTAAWKGNFTSADAQSVNGVYLIRNDNELVNDGAAIKIGSSKGIYLGNDASGSDWQNVNCTLVIAAKNPNANSRALIALGNSSAPTKFSVRLENSTTLKTYYKGTTARSTTLAYATTGDVPEYFGYSYQNVQNNGSIIGFNGTTAMDGGLMEGSAQIGRATIGGLRDNTLSTDAEISAVFLFKERLDGTELAKWTTPAVATLTADKHVEISADTTVSAATEVLSAEVKSAAKLTYSSAVKLTTLGGFFANAATTFDCSALNAETVLVSGPIYGASNINIAGSTLPSGMTLKVTDSSISLVNNYVNYSANVTGDVSWETKAGLSDQNPAQYADSLSSTITLTNNLASAKTVTFDKAVTAASLKLVGSGATTFATGNSVTPAIAAYDFSEATGGATLGYDIGSAALTIGSGTTATLNVAPSGAGTLVNQGTLVYNYAYNGATIAPTADRRVYHAGATLSGNLDLSSSAGSINFDHGTYTVTGYVLTGNNNNNAMLNLSGDAAVTVNGDSTDDNGFGKNTLNVSDTASLTMTRFVLAQRTGPTVVNLNGGTISVTGSSNVDNNTSSIMFGHYNAQSTFNQTAGSFTASGANVLVGKTGNTQTINISGGTFTALGIVASGSASGNNTLNLSGGEIRLGANGLNYYGSKRIAVNVNGDAKITATANMPIKQSITIASGKVLTLDTGTYTATVEDSTSTISGEGSLAKAGAGTLALGKARPGIKSVEGVISVAATPSEMAAGKIRFPYTGADTLPTASQFSVVKSDNTAVTPDSVTLAEGQLTLTFAVNTPVTTATSVSALEQGGMTGVAVIDGSAATEANPLVFTIDKQPSTVTKIAVLGWVRLNAGGSLSEVRINELVFDDNCQPIFGAPPNCTPYTVAAGKTVTYAGGADEANAFSTGRRVEVNGTLKTTGYVKLTGANSTVAAAGVLQVENGTLEFTSGGKSISGTVTVKAGATYVNKTGDAFNYDGSPILNVYGTYDGGNTRLSMGGSCRVNLYSGCVLNGEGDGNGAFDFIAANDNAITASAANGSTERGTVVVNCPIKLRNANQTQVITINKNTHIELHGAIIGAGNLQKNGNSSGNSTVAFYGANTFTGTLTVNAGYLSLMPGSSYACSGLTIASAAALQLGGTDYAASQIAPATSADQVVFPGSVTANGRIDVYGYSKLTGAVSGSNALNLKNTATLETTGTVNCTGEGSIAANATLHVLSGTTTYKASGSGISGTVTIDEGATFVNSKDSDGLNYGGSPTVNVKGTLSMGTTRWTVGGNNKINLYPGCSVTGAGSGNGAIDFYQANTNFKVVDDGDNTAAVNLAAALRFRDNGNATLTVGVPVTVNVSGTILGSKTFTLAGVNGARVASLTSSSIAAPIVVGTGVTLDTSVNVPSLTLNGGSTIKVPASGLTVGSTFTSSGNYHIDGAAVLTDTAEHTLITVPSGTTPTLTGVTVNGSDAKVWDLAAGAGYIKATYTERTEVHYDSATGKWVNESGVETAIDNTKIVRLRGGDTVAFTTDVTPYAVAFDADASVSMSGQSHLKVATLDIPAGCELTFTSNETPGVTAISGTGTLAYAPGAVDSVNEITAAQLANFAGTFWIKSGRHEYGDALTSAITIKITSGQLWAKGGTWNNRFLLSGNGWGGTGNDVEYAAMRLDATLGASASVEFEKVGDVTPGIGTTEDNDSKGVISAALKGSCGFEKRGNGRISLAVPGTQAAELSGDILVRTGTLGFGNRGDYGDTGDYTLGDRVIVNSGARFRVHLNQHGGTGIDETSKPHFETPVVLNGGELYKHDGSVVFASVDVAADSTFTGGNWGKRNIIRVLTGSRQLTVKAGDTADIAVFGGTFSGTIYVNHAKTSFIPKNDALEDATVQLAAGCMKLVDPAVTVGALTGAGSGVYATVNSTLTLKGGEYSGVIKDVESSGSTTLAVVIAGDVTLTGANTFTGGLTVESGNTLTVNAAAALGAGTVTVEGGAEIDFGAARNITAAFAGTGTLKFALTDAEVSAGAPLTLVTCADLTNEIDARDSFGRKYPVTETAGVYTIRSFAVTTDMMGVNFVSGKTDAHGGKTIDDEKNAGAVAMLGANWNQYTIPGSAFCYTNAGQTVKELLADGTIDKGAMKVVYTGKEAFGYGTTPSSGDGQLTFGYIDDGEYPTSSGHGGLVEVSSIPYSEYSLIVYIGSDGTGSIGPVTVNGTVYGAGGWGSRAATHETDGVITWVKDSNYLLVKGLTEPTVTIKAAVNGVPSGTRCGIAGIQILNTGTREVGPYEPPVSATATENADALDLNWTDVNGKTVSLGYVADPEAANNQLTVAEGKTATFNINLKKAIGPGTFKKTGAGSTTMSQTGTKPAAIEVAGGTLTFGNTTHFINGAADSTALPLTVSGGMLDLNNAYTFANNGSGWLGENTVTLGGETKATVTGGNFTFYKNATTATFDAITYLGGDNNENAAAEFAASIHGTYTSRERILNVTVGDGAGMDCDLLVSGDFGVNTGSYKGEYGDTRIVKLGTGTLMMTGNYRFPKLVVNAGTWKVGSLNAVAKTSTTVEANGVLDLNGQTVTIDSLAGAGMIRNTAGAQAVITNTCGGVFSGTIEGDVRIIVKASKLDLSDATLGADVTLGYDMANAAAGCGIELPNGSGKTVEAIGTSEKYQIGAGGLIERKTAMATLQDTLVWLPIGDSLTEGEKDMGHPGTGDVNTRGGYRYQLWSQLEASGQETRSVGYRSGHGGGGAGTVEPDDCRWAWHAAQYGGVIANDGNSGSHGAAIFNVENTLETAGYPDIITVLLGVNDLSFTANTYAGATNVFNSLDAMVCKLAAQRPNSKILVSTLLNAKDRAYIGRFNEILRAKNAAHDSPFDLPNVTLIDNHASLDPAATKEGLHPNEIGAVKVAESFSGYMAAAIAQINGETAKMVAVHNGETANVTVRFSKALAAGATGTLTLAGTDVNGNAANHVLTGGALDAADARVMKFAVGEGVVLTGGVYTATLSAVTGAAKDATAIDLGPLAADFVKIVGTGAAENVKSDFLAGFQRYQTVTLSDGTVTDGIGAGDNWAGAGPTASQVVAGDLRSHYIKRVGYYVELKRAGEPARFLWASMNAFDNDVTKAAIPTAAAGAHKAIVTNLQVYANLASVSNTVIGADGIDTNATGIVEFTPWGWGGTDQAGYVADMYPGQTGWNDTLSGNTLAGCMQVARYTGEKNPDHFTKFAAEMLFAFNNFNRAQATDIGFGSFAVNRKNDGAVVSSVWGWENFINDTQYKKYAVNAYEVKKIEIWAETDPAYVYTADVGADAKWSELVWKNAKGELATELPAGAELILNAAAENASLTLDANFTAGLFSVQSGAGTNLVITKAANVTVSVPAIDLTYANGTVTLWDTGLVPITVGGGNVVVAGGMTKTAEGYVSVDGAVTNKSGVLKIKDSDLVNVVLPANAKIEFYGDNTVAAASVGSYTSWTVKTGTTKLAYELNGDVTILRYTSYAIDYGATLECPKIYASWNWAGMRIDGLLKVAGEFARPYNGTTTLGSETGVLQADTFGWGNNSTWTIALKEMDLGSGGIFCRNSNYAYLKFGGNMTIGTLADWSTTSAFGLSSDITFDTENATNAVAKAQSVELRGVVSGNYGLVKTGLGTLTLNAANTFTGGVIVSNGTVCVANNAGLGTGAVTLSGGTLDVSANVTIGNAINVTDPSTVSAAAGKTNTVGGTVTGGANITVAGAGQVIFKTYRGAVAVADGSTVGYMININDCGAFAIPAGMDGSKIRLFDQSGKAVPNTHVEGGKIVYDWDVTGKNCWWDYEFNGKSGQAPVGTGTDTASLNLDGDRPQAMKDRGEYVTNIVETAAGAITNIALRVPNRPWRDVSSWPAKATFVTYGTMVKDSNRYQIVFGSTTHGNGNTIFLATGDISKDEVKLCRGSGTGSVTELCTMTVPNATTADHLYAFVLKTVDSHSVVDIYLDGELLQPFAFDQLIELGPGFQIASPHGGPVTGYSRPADDDPATLDWLRVYDTELNATAMQAYAAEYPYVSPHGTFSRTLASGGTWESVGAWKNEGDQSTTNTPAAGATILLKAEASSEMQVNLNNNVTYEALTIQAGSFVSITTNKTAAAAGLVKLSGRLTVGAQTMVNPFAIDLVNTPITIKAGQTLGFDLRGVDLSKFYEGGYVDLTGSVIKEDETTSVIGVYYPPAAVSGRTAEFVQNPQTLHYGLAITVDGAFAGTVTKSGNWSDSITWKAGDTVVAEPDWSILKNANLTIPEGTFEVVFDADRTFTNLTVTGSGACTFTKGGGVTVSARTLDVGAAAGFTVGSADLMTVTESLTLGTDLKASGIGHNDTVFTVSDAIAAPSVNVVVDGSEGGELLKFGNALKLYKPAPTVFTVTSITPMAQTNFNGSAVTVAYSKYEKGDYNVVTTKLTINGHDYVYEGELKEEGGTITFQVANGDALASNVCNAVVSVVGSGTTKQGAPDSSAYSNTVRLYQGAPVAGGAGTNGWFSTDAEHVNPAQGGAWSTPNPPVDQGKIIFDEDEQSEGYLDYAFEPTEPQAGQVAVVDMNLSFDAQLDEVVDASGAQAAVRIVTDGDTYRFAAVTNGVWTTNTTIAAALNTAYALRLTIDYRQVPARVKYEVKDGDVYQTIATGDSGTTKSALENVMFNGTGKLAVMTGSNIVDTVDASLVEDGSGNKYANIGAAIEAGVTNLTLLWNTAWQPPSGAGAFRISKGEYSWYYTPVDGLLVKLVDGTYVVVTDYWEAMNLYGGTETPYMYLTNAIVAGGETITNLYLLRDVDLGTEVVAVGRTMTLTGDTNILTGAGLTVTGGKLTIASGCIGIPYAANVDIASGRFNEETTNSWKEILGKTHTFAELTAPVRPGYKWQLMEKTKAPDPTKDEVLMPVTDADGEPVSVVVKDGWAQTVTGEKEPEKQSAALSVKQANGLIRLDNEILGLKDEAGDIPVITPHQSSTADKVTFSLGNVDPGNITASGARVKYRVYASTTPGGKDAAVSEATDPSAAVSVDLPTSGVQYYIIEVDTGAVK